MSWKIRRPRHRVTIALAAAVVLAAAGTATALAATASKPGLTPMTLTSPDFHDGGKLPPWTLWGKDPSCPGKDLAPALRWTNPPAGTKGFAVVVNDVDTPQSPGFTHWIVYNIPGDVTSLAGHGSNPYSEGATDYDGVTTGFAGPCPPPTGQPHHYVFRVFALDTASVPGTGLDDTALISEISSHMLWSASLIGTVELPKGS
ncbi:YbhB/YbcL family Raf kinase inhibitor-like protein [Catenulispora sp. NF23]|uniref:YbhB/YbcL family Raf kinase inhibitor-like protein n=1 Tax=Catenulispora pinistramenti TaxID=2705254 RepID=A0ABS5KP53_9ACTN|nr:YbhB/YbcL family Raf kinase inhibitor-like protein [Catenulispora pinistramenti]MBS2532286.1 YbhB/YbcL family Raf kinase inhibitor-like protein [Catenulispora pinistramenti]MBS2547811.1 YbhB/YbcL family Raf kinase inhibitor-like protein [Catenulispora pinistramenti]